MKACVIPQNVSYPPNLTVVTDQRSSLPPLARDECPTAPQNASSHHPTNAAPLKLRCDKALSYVHRTDTARLVSDPFFCLSLQEN
uniref:Uncharacterized protein n=1 Tax=Ascaris lumbricoides TaxID=6252 RepID=A0A0M3IHU5_ASCLU